MTKIILGSYTKKDSQGIYQTDLDTEKETLSTPTVLIKADSPTYLTTDAENNLYTINKNGEQGGVASFQLQNGQYTKTNGIYADGAVPCYVAIDEKRHFLYSANYHKGEIAVYQVTEATGKITACLDKVYHTGNGPHPNQEKPHVHYTDLAPDQQLVVCDLGTDEVYTYAVADATGKLTETARYQTKPGFGPRHLVFHPNGQTAYIIGELSNEIDVVTYEKGQFTHQMTISTLAAEFTGESTGGAIRISQDGKFLYASNRGENTIAVFAISEDTKKLTAIQSITTAGEIPRDFDLNPSQKFLIAANQNTGDLTLYARHETTGELSILQRNIPAPECVCIHFV